MILSDQLNVRSYSYPDSWAVGPLKTQAEEIAAATASGPKEKTPPAPVVPQHPLLSELNDEQRFLVYQLRDKTGLNIQWSRMCIDANGWNLENAERNFQELMANSRVCLHGPSLVYLMLRVCVGFDPARCIH